MTEADLVAAFRTQLQFLKNSCNLYDQGHIEEATRIATTLRILFHDTKNWPSLLTRLHKKDIEIATSIKDNLKFNILGISAIELDCDTTNPSQSKATFTCKPQGEETCSRRWLSATEWWEEPIYKFMDGKDYTRRDIALVATEKAGGAHVDATLPPIFAHLVSGQVGGLVPRILPNGNTLFGVEISVLSDEAVDGEQIKNIQLSDLRQMANELLASQDFLAIAKQQP